MPERPDVLGLIAADLSALASLGREAFARTALGVGRGLRIMAAAFIVAANGRIGT